MNHIIRYSVLLKKFDNNNALPLIIMSTHTCMCGHLPCISKGKIFVTVMLIHMIMSNKTVCHDARSSWPLASYLKALLFKTFNVKYCFKISQPNSFVSSVVKSTLNMFTFLPLLIALT